MAIARHGPGILGAALRQVAEASMLPPGQVNSRALPNLHLNRGLLEHGEGGSQRWTPGGGSVFPVGCHELPLRGEPSHWPS